MCDIDEKDLYWLAGLLEGEASFHLCKCRGAQYPVIRLKMCDRDVVEKAAGLLGCHRELLVVQPRSTKHKEQYVAHVIGLRAISWLRQLRPLMGERRQQQIDHVLANMSWLNPNGKHCRKLNPTKAREIRDLWQQRTMTQIEIAALYGVSKWTVNAIVNGHQWAD